ncbi:dephospho-CoA kinase [Cohnella lubricantis]|uniref:Dephospho-CoA kinase n=1 Tax=Cohnella lubricantis TaxID=2163172 RepID=A0A841T7L4_9BACL|nr:dephospho-CoA kinase [Cohnella lubricantis]MBB6676046.1 dephospho-CoA kinase [Cohnella lubricantis]MBP2118000.1 dephospho-CoA kinase [Cohnella lubricantis]
MNIGLTGGIAAGKSTVSRMLTDRGAALVDLDQIAREVVSPGQEPLRLIAERFGPAVLSADGTLNRAKLGEIVFSDDAERKALEAITHPAIRARMLQLMEAFQRERPEQLVVVDVPLLFESGLQSYFQQIMVVYVPRFVQLERLMKRSGLAVDEANRRIDAQMDIEEKRRLADIVIDNSGGLEETAEQVERFWRGKGLA